MFVNPGFEGLKIVSARKDGGREMEASCLFHWPFETLKKEGRILRYVCFKGKGKKE